jgi:hypothetical protein
VQAELLSFEDAGLVEDPDNMNSHNDKNLKGIEQSVDEVGFFRSIAIDENNVVKAGNGTAQIAKKKNAKILIVDVDDPNTLVAVRRKGLTTLQKHRAGLWDNETSRLSKRNDKAIQRIVKDNPGQMILEGIYSEKDQQKILKEHEDAQPLAMGGADDIELTSGDDKAVKAVSATRMVQLFLDVDTVTQFNERVKSVGSRCFPELGSITDITFAIVTRAFNEWNDTPQELIVDGELETGEDDEDNTLTN